MAKVKISLWVPHAFHPAITQYKSMQSFQLNRNPSALSQLHLFFLLKVYGKVKSILGALLSEAFETKIFSAYLVPVRPHHLAEEQTNVSRVLIFLFLL